MDFSSGLPQGPLQGIQPPFVEEGMACSAASSALCFVCGFASFFFSTETAAMHSFCPVASAQVVQVLQQVQFC